MTRSNAHTENNAALPGRQSLKSLPDRHFDVAVIGAGVNGATASQHMAAAGYSVLMVDKDDFGAGASSRSGRLLHCGLMSLEPGGYMNPNPSLWQFVRNPWMLVDSCKDAREALKCRAEMINSMPERVRAYTACYPIYDNGHYSGWQVDAAFALLKMLGQQNVPLDYRRLGAKEALSTGLLRHLRPEGLRGVATFRDHNFDWAERVVVDTVLDSERLGAVVRNYTAVEAIHEKGGQWELDLRDVLDHTSARVTAKAVINMGGPWVDDVNKLAQNSGRQRVIVRTKGTHMLVWLGEEYRDYGLLTLNSKDEHFYILPWRGFHYIGPTFTKYEGDLDNVTATEEEIEHLLAETNLLLPGLGLKRGDVLYSWAGVRPLTFSPSIPLGDFSRDIHDLSCGGPPLFALTGGTLGRHRRAGPETTAAISKKLKPSRRPQAPFYGSLPPGASNAMRPHRESGDLSADDVRRGIEKEHAETIADILFRRSGIGWSPTMGADKAQLVGQILAEFRGWDEKRTNDEVEDYLKYLHTVHGFAAKLDETHRSAG